MNPNPNNQNLSENKQANLRTTNIALVAMAAFFLGLRFLSRWRKNTFIGLDDYFAVLAYIFLLGLLTTGLLMIHNGLGIHAAALPIPNLVTVGKGLLAFECVYVTTVALTKISVLLMYCRIFPIRSMYIGCWILGFLSVSWAITIITVCIFQCSPIEKAWNPTLEGHCINLKGSFIGNAVPNILTDVAILTLPISQVWHLKINWVQRFQLSIVFLLGSFVVFTSIYRFTTLFQFVPSDMTWTLAKACTWCIVESSAGIVSACLPTLAPLLRATNFKPWRKNTSISNTRSVKEIITLTSTGVSKESRNGDFNRLDGTEAREGLWSDLEQGERTNIRSGAHLEGGAARRDEISPRSMQKKVNVQHDVAKK